MQTTLQRDADGDYLAPAFPPRVGGLLLADSGCGNWGIYEYDDSADSAWSPETPVTVALMKLIESAKRFPPALALARDDVSRVFRKRAPAPEELADSFEAALARRLSQQTDMRFVLARAVGEQFGFMCAGEWYWVLAASKDRTAVRWVSDDYFVYANPATDFELTDCNLDELQGTRVGLNYKDIFWEARQPVEVVFEGIATAIRTKP